MLEEHDLELQLEDAFTILRYKIQEKMKVAYEKNLKIFNARARFREFKVRTRSYVEFLHKVVV